jgi:hypothetical protein
MPTSTIPALPSDTVPAIATMATNVIQSIAGPVELFVGIFLAFLVIQIILQGMGYTFDWYEGDDGYE